MRNPSIDYRADVDDYLRVAAGCGMYRGSRRLQANYFICDQRELPQVRVSLQLNGSGPVTMPVVTQKVFFPARAPCGE